MGFSWKAVLVGIASMIVVGLFMQLLLAVTPMLYAWGFGESMMSNDYKDTIFNIVGLMGFALTLLCGGFITGYVAREAIYSNAAIAGAGVIGLSLLLSRSGGELTSSSATFLLAGVVLAMLGAFLWQRGNQSLSNREGQ